jgi:predicted ATPase
MEFLSFRVRNFKGINDLTIDFEGRPRSNVYTFVGLNESGKTTILEALKFFSPRSDTDKLDPLNIPGYVINDIHELIPISKRSNFNDAIGFHVRYRFDEQDKRSLKLFLMHNFKFELTSDIDELEITQTYQFRDSRVLPDQPLTEWNIPLVGHYLTSGGKARRTPREKQITDTGESHEKWHQIISYIETLLPSVLYFPNFLFEFPDRIYLEPTATIMKDAAKHEFYRLILQDVLDSIGESMTLQTHILKRAKSDDKFDKQHLALVLLKLGNHISATVFKHWNDIFKRKIGNKEIVVSHDNDDNGWFLQLKVKDSGEQYEISERSLGFRWFFAFFLLTRYRAFRKGAPRNVLFLFDEPASNLHSSAQTQLLDSFGNYPPSCIILYTTHSHHMINPNWLEGAFVVRNEGLDYEAEDEFSARSTVITLERYRTFVSQHPNQTTYYQPILEVLDYRPGRLENVPDVVMLEGKNDFYTLNYFHEKLLSTKSKVNLMPGGGSGNLDDPIRLYSAWGRNFIVLLDSDEEGLIQKKRYEDIFGLLVKDRIFSLEDVDRSWKRRGMEYMLAEPDRLAIQQFAYPSASKYKKMHFNRAIQELYLIDRHITLSKETLENFKKLLDFCADKLANQT